MRIRSYVAVMLVGGFIAAGCVMTDDLGDLESGRAAVTTENALSYNALSYNALSYNALSYNALSYNSLSDEELELDQSNTDLAETESGREVLTYIARCALPDDVTLVATVDDVTYEFPGSLALAPEWADEPLDLAGQRWVSACLLAHANYFGLSVPLSLRGTHPALQVTGAELDEYTAEEGAFYGNLFGDDAQLLSCIGWDALDSSSSPYLDDRICATDVEADGQTVCGFAHMGSCYSSNVCKGWTLESGYAACRTSTNSSSDRQDEVITVFLPGHQSQ